MQTATLTKEQTIRAVVESCMAELASNFELPAIEILALYGAKIGVTSAQMQAIIDREG